MRLATSRGKATMIEMATSEITLYTSRSFGERRLIRHGWKFLGWRSASRSLSAPSQFITRKYISRWRLALVSDRRSISKEADRAVCGRLARGCECSTMSFLPSRILGLHIQKASLSAMWTSCLWRSFNRLFSGSRTDCFYRYFIL